MKKKLLAGLMLAAALFLTACGSNYSGDAVVESKVFHPHYSYVTWTHVGKTRIPVSHTVPDKWAVELRGTDGKTFSVNVDHSYYDWAEKGRAVHVDKGEIVR